MSAKLIPKTTSGEYIKEIHVSKETLKEILVKVFGYNEKQSNDYAGCVIRDPIYLVGD